METCRIIVLGTSDLARETPAFAGQSPVYEQVWRRRLWRWYSTGRLEQALRIGCEVCVCSVRPVFGPQDAWWRELVRADRTFAPRWKGASGQQLSERLLYEPWKRFFRHAGLRWPDDGRDGIDVRRGLDGRFGVLYGGYLQGFTLAS